MAHYLLHVRTNRILWKTKVSMKEMWKPMIANKSNNTWSLGAHWVQDTYSIGGRVVEQGSPCIMTESRVAMQDWMSDSTRVTFWDLVWPCPILQCFFSYLVNGIWLSYVRSGHRGPQTGSNSLRQPYLVLFGPRLTLEYVEVVPGLPSPVLAMEWDPKLPFQPRFRLIILEYWLLATNWRNPLFW